MSSDAVLLQPPADVINLSIYTGACGEFCAVFFNGVFEYLIDAIQFARGYNNAVIIGIAGNNRESNVNRLDNIPCTLDGVLCVGAIDWMARREPYSGAGPRVAIWAPDCIPTTPDPSSGSSRVV